MVAELAAGIAAVVELAADIAAVAADIVQDSAVHIAVVRMVAAYRHPAAVAAPVPGPLPFHRLYGKHFLLMLHKRRMLVPCKKLHKR